MNANPFTADSLVVVSLLLRLSVLVSAMALVCQLAARLLANRSAALRHAVWLCGLVAAAAVPIIALTTPLQWGEPISSAALSVEAGPDRPGSESDSEAASPLEGAPLIEVQRAAALRIASTVRLVWLAGVAVLLLHALVGALRLHWLIGRANRLNAAELPLSVALPAGLRLYESSRVPFPLATGVLRPVIVLPAGALSWPPGRLRYALLHELAHLKRGDVLAQLTSCLACALHWFNPLVWSARRNCVREAERACDDAVLRAGVRPSAYATYLLDLARHALRADLPSVAVGQGSELEGRISAVLQQNRARDASRRWSMLGVVLAALVAVGFGTHRGLGQADVADPITKSDGVSSSSTAYGSALVGLLNDHHAAVRAAAARSVGELELRGAIPHLIATLQDPAETVRARAAHALGDLEAASAIPNLQQALLHDPSSNVRREAAAALGEMETRTAVAALASAFGHVTDASSRRQIVRALGETRMVEAVAILEPLVQDVGGLSGEALQALTRIESPEARSALLRALRNGSAEVRRLAARAVAEER